MILGRREEKTWNSPNLSSDGDRRLHRKSAKASKSRKLETGFYHHRPHPITSWWEFLMRNIFDQLCQEEECSFVNVSKT